MPSSSARSGIRAVGCSVCNSPSGRSPPPCSHLAGRLTSMIGPCIVAVAASLCFGAGCPWLALHLGPAPHYLDAVSARLRPHRIRSRHESGQRFVRINLGSSQRCNSHLARPCSICLGRWAWRWVLSPSLWPRPVVASPGRSLLPYRLHDPLAIAQRHCPRSLPRQPVPASINARPASAAAPFH